LAFKLQISGIQCRNLFIIGIDFYFVQDKWL